MHRLHTSVLWCFWEISRGTGGAGPARPGLELPAWGKVQLPCVCTHHVWLMEDIAHCLSALNLKHWHINLSWLTWIIACLASFYNAMDGLLWSGQKHWKTYSVANSGQLLCKHTQLRWPGFGVANAGLCKRHKSQNWNVRIHTPQISFAICHRCIMSYLRFSSASLKILFGVFALKILKKPLSTQGTPFLPQLLGEGKGIYQTHILRKVKIFLTLQFLFLTEK